MSDRPFGMQPNHAHFSPRSPQKYPDYQSSYGQTYSQSRRPPQPSQTEQVLRFAGFGVAFGSKFAQEFVSHPFIVLRRQCQIHSLAGRHHLTPFTLIPVIVKLQTNQPWGAMWKGFYSELITKGIFMVGENVISEVTYFPKEISKHSTAKKVAQHLGLKSMAFGLTTTFYISSLLESVQSSIASEKPGIFDCVMEGCSRLIGRGSYHSRVISVWYLILPTVMFRMSQYFIQTITHFTVTTIIKREKQENSDSSTPVDAHHHVTSVYDQYYPELLATFVGSLLTDCILYPFETVLHRLYVQGTRTLIENMDSGIEITEIRTQYEGIVDCFKTILLEEGLQGLYQGFGAVVLQYMVHAGILKVGQLLFKKISEELSGGQALPGPSSRSH